MSEPRFEMLDDYVRELDRDADLIVPPSSPSDVRRVGASRRRRRLVALVAVLVTVALALGGVVVANLTSRRAAPIWANATSATATPTASVTSSPTTIATPTTKSTVVASSVIDRVLPFSVSTATFTADTAFPAAWDPRTTMSGDPTSAECGAALNGSFVSGTRGVTYRRTGAPADQPDWGYVIAYADASAASGAARSVTRALTVVCTPVDTPRNVAPRSDGIEVLAFTTSGGENGAKGIYVIRDRNVLVYHVDGMDLDANAIATAVDARLDQAETAPGGTTTSARASASSTATQSVRPVVASGDVITMLGIGELTIGMKRSELVSRGVLSSASCYDVRFPAPTLNLEGIYISSTTDSVGFIALTTAQHSTQSGATVGMTMGKVKQIYGDKVGEKTVTLEIADPAGNKRQAYVISSGNTLVFMTNSQGAIQASDVVTVIYLLKGAALSVPAEIC